VFNGHWKFSKLEDNKVEVEYSGLTNPGGLVPAWVINMVALDVPYKSLRNLQKILGQGKTKYDTELTISL